MTESKNKIPQHVVVDVESDGPVPGLYSMTSFAIVPLYKEESSFTSTIRPITDQFVQEALDVCGHSREQTMGFRDPELVMQELKAWCDANGPFILWSDNPTFDGMWLAYYCHKYLGYNPFGHSGRRIGDLYAGFVGDIRKTSDWKKYRTVKHTHDPLDDARGNAGALRKIISMIKGKE